MLVHSKIDKSTVNGPGVRSVLWFAGCTLGCRGCFNPDTHAFDHQRDVSPSEIFHWLEGLQGQIEGVTFSGGEPLQHAPSLYILLQWIREHMPKLSIGLYTGYTETELQTGRWQWHSLADGEMKPGSSQLWDEIKKHIDFAVMGRYNPSQASTASPLCGSSNQHLVLFSSRYAISDFSAQAVEVVVDGDGLIQVTGFPDDQFRKDIQA